MLAALIPLFSVSSNPLINELSILSYTIMDSKGIKRFEYEEQMFQFSSQFFADCFKNFMATELNSSVDVLVDSFKNKLIKESKNPEEFSRKVEEMKDKLKAEYISSLNAEFDNIKEKISKSMEIPEHVLLKEDLLVKAGSSTDIAQVENDISNLNGKYKAMRYLKKKLQTEIEKADYTIFTLKSITEQNNIGFRVLDTNEIISLRKSNLELVK